MPDEQVSFFENRKRAASILKDTPSFTQTLGKMVEQYSSLEVDPITRNPIISLDNMGVTDEILWGNRLVIYKDSLEFFLTSNAEIVKKEISNGAAQEETYKGGFISLKTGSLSGIYLCHPAELDKDTQQHLETIVRAFIGGCKSKYGF